MFFENLRRCLGINLNDYENIGVNLEINKVVLAAFVVFGVMMVVLSIYRKNMRDIVMQLMRHEAYSEDSACTLEELKLNENRVVTYMLTHSDMLKKIVERVGKPQYTYEEYKALSKEERAESERIDFATAKFYITEAQLDRARHVKEKYVVDKTRLIIACVFLFVVYIALAAAMPEILNVINNLLKKSV